MLFVTLPRPTFDDVSIGISSATSDLNVGAAAVLPLAGPARTRLTALVPYGFFVSPYASARLIVVFSVVFYAVFWLDTTGLVACTLTLVTPELVTYPLLSTNVATASDVGRLGLVEVAEIDVSTPFAAASANVPTLAVVRFEDPAHVESAVFSTFPSQILDLVIFMFLVAEPLYVN